MHMSPGLLRTLAVACIVLTTSACGGGGSGGGTPGTPPPPPPPTEPDPSVSLAPHTNHTNQDITHFLQRTHFGALPVDRDAVTAAGFDAYVDAMMTFPVGTPVEAQAMTEIADPAFPERNELEAWWLSIMTNTTTPFQEVLAMFWHDHFALGHEVLDGEERYWMITHTNLLRRSGTGNFRQFLIDMSLDWAMLDWLDGFRSRVGNINENWAREFWELFTLGEGNGYTQADIEEAARAFTGYRERNDAMTGQDYVEYDETRHDTGDKNIFGMTLTGRSGPDSWMEYVDMVDLTLNNRPVAEYIVTKIWDYFVYLDPPQEVVSQLAQIFRDNNYEIAPVLQVIFKSEAFFSDRAKAGLIKSPVDYLVGFIRASNLQQPLDRLDDHLEDAGQLPMVPPNVAGWEQGTLWLSSQNMIERANGIQRSIEERGFQGGLGIDPADLLPQPPVTAEKTVARLKYLLNVRTTPAEDAIYVTYLNNDMDGGGVVSPDPFDPADPVHIDERVRGLLYILSQHPSAHVK